jgi:hypothetical protein
MMGGALFWLYLGATILWIWMIGMMAINRLDYLLGVVAMTVVVGGWDVVETRGR